MEDMKKILSEIQADIRDIKFELKDIERKASNGNYTYTESREEHKK